MVFKKLEKIGRQMSLEFFAGVEEQIAQRRAPQWEPEAMICLDTNVMLDLLGKSGRLSQHAWHKLISRAVLDPGGSYSTTASRSLNCLSELNSPMTPERERAGFILVLEGIVILEFDDPPPPHTRIYAARCDERGGLRAIDMPYRGRCILQRPIADHAQ